MASYNLTVCVALRFTSLLCSLNGSDTSRDKFSEYIFCLGPVVSVLLFASYIFISNLNGKKSPLMEHYFDFEIEQQPFREEPEKGPQTLKTASGHL